MTRKPTLYDIALWAALPMAHTTHLEKRLAMILDKTRRRALPRRFPALALIGGALLAPAAMLHPVAQGQAVRTGARAEARATALPHVPGAKRLENEGMALTPAAAAALERRLAVRPDDYEANIRLLGYYETRKFLFGPRRAPYDRQVFWLIRTHPESVLAQMPTMMILKRNDSAAFEKGKALWLEQVAAHPTNTLILSNAADYCLLSDHETAEHLLRQAEALEPKNPAWPNELGYLYQLQGRNPTPQERLVGGRKALAEYEAAAALSPDKTLRSSTSPDLAKSAFDAGEFEKARQYADALMRRGQGKNGESYAPGEDTHEANMVLGRLALHDGNVALAEQYLLAMGRVPDTSAFSAFVPNMQLAKDLLDRGDRAPVLAYFDECAKFWTGYHGALNTWKAQVQAGKTPDFQGNLLY